MESESALEKAIRLAGGQSALAREATRYSTSGKRLTQGMIWKWLHRARELVPSGEWVIPIERAVHGAVSRHELRPDLYPKEQRAA